MIMKKICVAAVSMLLLTGCSASVDPHYEITRDVYGVVQETRYSFEWNYSDFQFDQNGNVIGEEVSGDSRNKITYEYDSNNRLSKSVVDSGMYGITTKEYSYNDDGTVNEIKFSTTDSNYKVKNFTEKYTYSGGKLSGIDSMTKGGEKAYNEYTYDEFGRVIVNDYYVGNAIFGKYEYYYGDTSINPVTYSYRSSYNAFVFANTYDDRGNLIREDVLDNDGERSSNTYSRGVIGSVTESPESNADLIGRDQWTYFAKVKDMPVPSSCFRSVTDGTSENTFVLPSSQGMIYPGMGDPTTRDYGFMCADDAFVVYDQYFSILTQVCGFTVENSGNTMNVSKDGSIVADVIVSEKPGTGYVLEVSFH